MKKNVLILCPPFSDKGGVAYYYFLVQAHFQSKYMTIDYFHTGKNYNEFPETNRLLKSLYDLFKLFRIIPHYDLIILNPSLDHRSIIRDGVFHVMAKHIFRKKTLVFFHGWIPEMEDLIYRHFRSLMRLLFQSDCLCVLANQFKKSFISWGFNPETIIVETTVYEQKGSTWDKNPFHIVFLSRFVEGKGCLEAIQTIEILIKKHSKIKLFMAGDGYLLPQLQSYVSDRGLNDHVIFTGYLKGDSKLKLLEQCGIMLYPTNYGEGMPISLLEGMGMGCIVISRPAGGIGDIVRDGENGFLINSLNPLEFANRIDFLYQNPEIMKLIAFEGIREATKKFEISNAIKRLEKIYLKTATCR